MFKIPKNLVVQFVATILLFVAATGANTACWWVWYQPKMPDVE